MVTTTPGINITLESALADAYQKHFVGQALRWAFLCGEDRYIKRNYDHRRQWVVNRLPARQITII